MEFKGCERMKKTIFFCDYCQKEIGQEVLFYYSKEVYNDDFGENLKYDYDFCCKSCMKMFKEENEHDN
jgi:hypothetical protein